MVLFAASGLNIKNGPPTGDAFKNDGPIREVERNPGRLTWSIPEDAFARYICHCVCRWHNVVSYSQYPLIFCGLREAERFAMTIAGKAQGPDDTSSRLTYILRPNPTRMNGAGGVTLHMASLDTPPATELDSASSMAFDSSQETDYAWSEEHSDYPPSDADDSFEDLVEVDGAETSESFVEAGSLSSSIPDMRASLTLPPITQHTTLRPQARSPSSIPSSIPHEADSEGSEPSMFRTPLPIRALNMLSINDEEDFASLAILAQGGETPTRTPRPRIQTSATQSQRRSRLAIRSSSRRSNSLSSSPSRSPSSMRWRATLASPSIAPSISRGTRIGSALPARLAPQGSGRNGKKAKKNQDQNQDDDGKTRTLWSFVYEH